MEDIPAITLRMCNNNREAVSTRDQQVTSGIKKLCKEASPHLCKVSQLIDAYRQEELAIQGWTVIKVKTKLTLEEEQKLDSKIRKSQGRQRAYIDKARFIFNQMGPKLIDIFYKCLISLMTNSVIEGDFVDERMRYFLNEYTCLSMDTCAAIVEHLDDLLEDKKDFNKPIRVVLTREIMRVFACKKTVVVDDE